MSRDDAPETKKTSIVEKGSKFLACQLRLLSVLQALAGAGYIAVAVVLQFPPGDPLTLGLWAIGVLAIVTAVSGLFGGCRLRCCLSIYTVLAVMATLGQAAFVLYLFIAPEQAEKQISNYQKTKQGKIKENLHTIINMGRWVLLGLLGAQVLAIVVASVLRCCTKNTSYEEFQDEEAQEYELRASAAAEQLEQLKAKLGRAAAAAEGAGGKKQVFSISAVSGSAAERMQQQQHAMRSVLFQRSDVEEGKLDSEAEKISARVDTDAESGQNTSNPWDMPSPQPSPSAWPQSVNSSPQRPFKPSWSKAGRQ